MCLNCNTPTKNPKFCSRSCAASFNNKKYPKRAFENNCKACDEPISGNRTYCRSCFGMREFGRRTKAQVQTEAAYQTSARIRSNARTVYKKSKRPKACQECGYDMHVDICHVIDIKDFPDTALISEINDITNLVPLCKNHHWEFDNGHLVI